MEASILKGVLHFRFEAAKRKSHFSFKVAESTGKICTPQLLMALALL